MSNENAEIGFIKLLQMTKSGLSQSVDKLNAAIELVDAGLEDFERIDSASLHSLMENIAFAATTNMYLTESLCFVCEVDRLQVIKVATDSNEFLEEAEERMGRLS